MDMAVRCRGWTRLTFGIAQTLQIGLLKITPWGCCAAPFVNQSPYPNEDRNMARQHRRQSGFETVHQTRQDLLAGSFLDCIAKIEAGEVDLVPSGFLED